MRQLNGRFCDIPAKVTFDNGRFSSIIDLILTEVSAWGKIGNFEVVPRAESDHNPLLLIWRWLGKANTAPSRNKPNEIRNATKKLELVKCKQVRTYDDYTEELSKCIKKDSTQMALHKFTQAEDPMEVFLRYEQLMQQIIESLGKNKKKKHRYVSYSSWFDDECATKKKYLNNLIQDIAKASPPLRASLILLYTKGKLEFNTFIIFKKKTVARRKMERFDPFGLNKRLKTILEASSQRF